MTTNDTTPEPCPRCHCAAKVRRKLLTFPHDWSGVAGQTIVDGEHFVFPPHLGQHNHGSTGGVVNGFYCDVCGKGFVPDVVLGKLGTSEREILSTRIFAPHPLDDYT